MFVDFFDSPIGLIEINASVDGVTKVIFVESVRKEVSSNELTKNCQRQLLEYFTGQRKIFDLRLDLQGTAFQKSVWHCLLNIPFGDLASYLDVGNMIENPKAVRAIGAANGKNPISIVVPCHRVIGSDGTLTGYAGGLERKAWLLKHEGITHKVKFPEPERCKGTSD